MTPMGNLGCHSSREQDINNSVWAIQCKDRVFLLSQAEVDGQLFIYAIIRCTDGTMH